MLHALYFQKSSHGTWKIIYNNKHVETETYNLEKQRNKPMFLPAAEGHSLAILSAYLLNWLRSGTVNKYISNTNVFEHSGKFYSIAESHMPQEIDIFSLKTLNNWELSEAWNRPFTSHPKKAPTTEELVIFGFAPTKPYVVVGIVSADGKKLVHKVDIKLNRCSICHDIGVTQRYNVIMDFPLTIDLIRLLRGGPLMKYDKKEYARIGVMPRYGNAESIKWFEVEPNCTFHIINSFEDGDEVVVRGCRSLDSLVPKPDPCSKEFDCLSRSYEWRLNMRTGEVKEKDLCGDQVVYMDFPMINENFVGIKHRYAYTQVVDHIASSTTQDVQKYRGLAKLYFEEAKIEKDEGIKMEYHMFEKNTYCNGAAFVARDGGVEEDDGWIITFVHNEDTNKSQVHIIDTKNFCAQTVVKIELPCRVPYGFHGAFMPISFQDH
ncbi:unnamed protein product [Vicia faba]|uniref:Uncharacterized protein n=1 Tax=Vicia faba TaxID=3906 RepID=A0AAV0ZMG2_VICFA|nr:unnamed protein product [Vicia faba]